MRDIVIKNKSPLGLSNNFEAEVTGAVKNEESHFLRLLKQVVSDKKKTLSVKQNDVIDREKRSLTRRTLRFNQNQEVSAQMIKQCGKKIFKNDPLDKKAILDGRLA